MTTIKIKHNIVLTTSVYLNCCSTFFITPPHSKHLKVPWRSSGRTSLVLVTTPVTDTSLPISDVPNSLNLQKGKLSGEQNARNYFHMCSLKLYQIETPEPSI